MGWIMIGLLFVIIGIFILVLNTEFSIECNITQKKIGFKSYIILFKNCIKYRINPENLIFWEKNNDKKNIVDFINNYKEDKKKLIDIINFFKRKITITNINMSLRIGLNDAFVVAIISGAIWTLIGIFKLLIKNYFIVEEEKFMVKPTYDLETLDVDMNCIFRVKIVHIIFVGTKILLYRWWKRGKRASYTRTYGYCNAKYKGYG